jgi:hypothetical protein
MPRTRTVKSSGLNRNFGLREFREWIQVKLLKFLVLFCSVLFGYQNIDTSNFMQDRLFAKTNFGNFLHGTCL